MRLYYNYQMETANQSAIIRKSNHLHMKFKPNYLIIPLVTIVTAFLGSTITRNGMDWYYYVLGRPTVIPPTWVFPLVWNIIFICTTISALIIWNHRKNSYFWWIIGLFIANAILNIFWSFLFFNLHLLKASFFEMFFLEATIVALMIMTWKTSKIASYLLLPYLIWVAIATYFTYQIILLNA